MFYNEYFPFHTVYGNPAVFTRERLQEREFALMKSFYPETARKIQNIVETECEILDYEGSRLYDEYPDKYMMRRLSDQIREQVSGELSVQGIPHGNLDELVQVLLYQEISRRRCRRCRNRFF